MSLQIFGYLILTVSSSAHWNNLKLMRSPKRTKLGLLTPKKIRNQIEPTWLGFKNSGFFNRGAGVK